MARFLFWRMARTVLAVWLLASGVFLLSRRDADAAVQLELPDPMASGSAASPGQMAAARQAIRQRLGFNQPLFYVSRDLAPASGTGRWHWNGRRNQYHQWLRQLLRGNLGVSLRTGQAVTQRLGQALAFTLPLTGTAAVLATLAALALAQRMATRPWWQRPLRVVLVMGHALPLFLVALLLLLVFANPAVLPWFPAFGLEPMDDPEISVGGQLTNYLAHLALPVMALVITALPELTLQLEATLMQELGPGYATTARAKGLSEKAVVRHHALRNALLPSLTQLAELLPALVAGAVVVEVVFALPGMGRLLAQAAAARDYPVLVAGVLLTGAARALALLIADVLYFWTDPRIRWQS